MARRRQKCGFIRSCLRPPNTQREEFDGSS
jgi:hypothetical protein